MEAHSGDSSCNNTLQQQRRYFIAISGCAASGKTTMAVLLRHVFGSVVLRDRPIDIDFLFQDNYLRPAEKCPQVSFSDATERYALYGPHGMVVTKVHSKKPFGVQAPDFSIPNQAISLRRQGTKHLTQQSTNQPNTLKDSNQRRVIRKSRLSRHIRAETDDSYLGELHDLEKKCNDTRFPIPKPGLLLNQDQGSAFAKHIQGQIKYIDPKLIMPNDELIYCGALRGMSKLLLPGEGQYFHLPNTSCRDAIDWHSFSIDFNFLQNGGIFEERRMPQTTGQRGTLSLLAVELDLKVSGLLDSKPLVDLRRAIKDGIEKIMKDNAEAHFEGYYVRNGNVRLCILSGSLLFLEDVQGLKSETLMMATDSNVFLQVSRKHVEGRQFARQFVRPDSIEQPYGKKSDREIGRDMSYFDRITWPQYVSDQKWIFADQNVESNILRNGEGATSINEALSDKAQRMDVVAWTGDGSRNKLLFLIVHQILDNLKSKERRMRDRFIASQP